MKYYYIYRNKIINSLIANTFMKILIFPFLIISQIIFSQAGFLKLGNNINGEAIGDESGISVGINSLGNRIYLLKIYFGEKMQEIKIIKQE